MKEAGLLTYLNCYTFPLLHSGFL